MFSGAYSGASSNPLPSTKILDAEYELFTGVRRGTSFRMIVAYDTAFSRVAYGSATMGRRYYFWSSAFPVKASDGGNVMVSAPKKRFYAGWDAGLSYSIVSRFGQILTANTTSLDLNANAGFIYQLGQNWGLELQAGYGYAYGFSNIAVNLTTMRILFGAAFYF